MPTLFLCVVFAVIFAPDSRSALINNGDFEILDSGGSLFEAWINGAGVRLAQEALEGERSARIERNGDSAGNALNQNPADPLEVLSQFTFSCRFATNDAGSAGARSLHLSLRTTPGTDSGNINLRVVPGSEFGRGTIQVFHGTWETVLANAVQFSGAETGAGLVPNTLTIEGNYTGPRPLPTRSRSMAPSPHRSRFSRGRRLLRGNPEADQFSKRKPCFGGLGGGG